MDAWVSHFAIEKELVDKLTAEGFNTLEVLKLLEASDLESMGGIKIGFRKKILLAVEHLKGEKWKPPSPTPSVEGSAPAKDLQGDPKTWRCCVCHKMRVYRQVHQCSRKQCESLDGCPTNFVRAHDPVLRAADREKRKRSRERIDQHLVSTDGATNLPTKTSKDSAQLRQARELRFLEEELTREEAHLAAKRAKSDDATDEMGDSRVAL